MKKEDIIYWAKFGLFAIALIICFTIVFWADVKYQKYIIKEAIEETK